MIDIEQQEHDDDAAGGEVGRAVAAILAARPQFRVGDRVRVLARECRYCEELHDEEVGLTGTVFDLGANYGIHRGHNVWVEFDEPNETDCGLSHFVATELELLSTAGGAS